MSKIVNKLKALKPTKRKIMQLYFALLFNANLKGFASGNIYQGQTKKMCVPGINCYSCPGAVGACPLGSLQGSFSADKSTLFYVGGILLLYSILFGRMICGWLCPFGLIQELFYKIKTPKIKKGPVTRVLSFFKYVVLVFFVFCVPIMYAVRDVPLPAFCKYICPAGTLEGGIALLANRANNDYFTMLGPLFTWKFLLLVSICVSCVFIFRMFCRFVCPLGALYGLFNKISVFGVKVKKDACIGCDKCIRKCKMDIKTVGDSECISCGECVSECPTNAIVWKGKGVTKYLPDTVKGNEKIRKITRGATAVILAAFLGFSIVHYWRLEDVRQKDPTVGNAEEGNEVGAICFGSDLAMVDENGFDTATVNPAKEGKVTVINFWGTWCTPCVEELPYFDRIATEYKDEVSVIAIHSFMGQNTAPDYIKNYYPDSEMTFAGDLDGDAYYKMLGGRGTYPYTVVLDEDGKITRVFFKSLEYDELHEAVLEALGE